MSSLSRPARALTDIEPHNWAAALNKWHAVIAIVMLVNLSIVVCHLLFNKVMVPLTEVAFMPGTIAGETVMVGLGQDYYVERTPREAQAVLQRRIAGVYVRGKRNPTLEVEVASRRRGTAISCLVY